MTLKGFVKLGDSTLINDITENLISYLDYNLLQMGNFVSVEVPSTGIYGGLDSRLRPVADPRFASGRVWATFHPNLVWESGGVSGVYVDSVFYPSSGTGTYSHYIDHINGRVVFDSGISSTGIVECDYSYKYCSIQRANGLPWFKQIQENARSDGDFTTQSGVYEILPEDRVVLPIIGIELAGRSISPYQLGGGQNVTTSFYCHCVAEDAYTRDSLVDALTYQAKTSFQMYDLNEINDANAFPLDYRGVPVSGALTYPDLVTNYGGRTVYISDATLDSTYTLGQLSVGTVKITTIVVHYGV